MDVLVRLLLRVLLVPLGLTASVLTATLVAGVANWAKFTGPGHWPDADMLDHPLRAVRFR